jgi:hypothetical protein
MGSKILGLGLSLERFSILEMILFFWLELENYRDSINPSMTSLQKICENPAI